MLIKLIKPHPKQKEIINSCIDESIFFLIAVVGRQFGKTTLAENMAIYWAINFPNSVVYWVSPTDSQSQKVYKEIINAIFESGVVKSKKMPKGDTEIVFENKSKILFRSAQSEDNLRGQSVDYMILDEAAFIKETTVNSILLPMLNVKGKKCLVTTTPKSKNWVFNWYNKGLTDPKWKSFRFSTYDSPLANKELINMFKQTLPEKLFQQEVLAEFVDSASVFNNIQDILCLPELNEPNNNDTYYGGIDIGFINDASVLSIINSEGDLVKFYRWENVEAPELIEEIIKICNKWKFKKIWIENNNQGLTIYQDLKRKVKNIEEFNTNTKTKPEIINNLIHLFNMKNIKCVNNELLRIELEGFIFINKDGKIKFMADSGFHDDIIMSFAIARECYEAKKYNIKYIGFK